LVREYLLEEGLLREKLQDPRLEFGFQFIFPKGADPAGKPIGRHFLAIKPANQNYLEISSATRISPEHIKCLNALEPKTRTAFFNDIKKIFLLKNMFFTIDAKDNKFAVIDSIFLGSDKELSKNLFFKSVRKIFTCTLHAITILEDYCGETTKFKGVSTTRAGGFRTNETVIDDLHLASTEEYRTVHIVHLKKLIAKLKECGKGSKETRDLIEEIEKEYNLS